MKPYKVLVVDDSSVARSVISTALERRDDMKVVGTARNGRIALDLVERLRPDAMVLDVEMPEMDGLDTLRAVRRQGYQLPVVMCSTHTRRGAIVTVDALTLGADDYVNKPSGGQSRETLLCALENELGGKLAALMRSKWRVRAKAPPRKGGAAVAVLSSPQHRPPREPVEAIVIAASTGGPQTLREFLPALPSGLGVPIFIVQHMPPRFTAQLAKRLDQVSHLEVLEGEAGMKAAAGRAIVAPGAMHMTVERRGSGVFVGTNQDPPENSCRPAADVLFRSAVRAYGGGLLGIVLTGMGRDGLEGARRIVETGGRVLAQDEDSSVVWGMPGAVATAGLADEVVALAELPAATVQRLSKASLASRTRERKGR